MIFQERNATNYSDLLESPFVVDVDPKQFVTVSLSLSQWEILRRVFQMTPDVQQFFWGCVSIQSPAGIFFYYFLLVFNGNGVQPEVRA